MSYRKEKLEGQIQRIVSELLIKDIKDPRIGFATITSVDLSKDYSQARIGVSVLGDARDLRKTMEGLESATPYIQHHVGKSLGIRVMPKIKFYTDSSIAEGVKMVHLLNTLEDNERTTADNADDKEEKEPADDVSGEE